MRRTLTDTDPGQFIVHDVDVAIIGSGLAGLYTAYHLPESMRCALFTKNKTETSSSSLAQGGIAAVTEKDDQFLYHYMDTIIAGAGLCDEDAVRLIVQEGPGEIETMRKIGTRFDLDGEGRLMTTREGGHGMHRILHAGGDATGLEMVRALGRTMQRKQNVRLHENAFVADVLTRDGQVCGLTVFEDDYWHLYRTRFLVVASGGAGQIYRYTTNPVVATADGVAMAMRAGAKLKDMEFIQFHPTGLYTPENRNRQCFLISEAVRGEGGILLNEKGEQFMKAVHPLGELAPRDIVSREIYKQIQNQTLPYVRLRISFADRDFLITRFPTIYASCLERGIDITRDDIPVGPVQHYMMGGVQTDLWGRTDIDGLFCCGEAACTGVHGANRLASNSTLECLVFGRRCAQTIAGEKARSSPPMELPASEPARDISFDAEENIIALKGIMVKFCGILRNGEELRYGLSQVEAMLETLHHARLRTVRDMELYNMASAAGAILQAA
ncbi:MAG: L-aspartate oxidase, partial [Bacillota bacterium]